MARWIVILLMLAGFVCWLPFTVAPAVEQAATIEQSATLEVDIQYDDDFYVEVFNYSRDAENVRHYVMVVPESEIERATNEVAWVFTGLLPQEDGSFLMREDRIQDGYDWGLPYIYSAPGGVFSGEFPPGTYGVAAAFITAPLSREDADAGDDAVLWAGITGGGANTQIQTVELVAGETTAIDFPMTDSNGWACPWLYVFDGENYVRYGEILRNIRGEVNARAEITDLINPTIVDGAIVLRIAEEEEEISVIDAFYLLVDGEPVYADNAILNAVDGDSLILNQGESIDLRFVVNSSAETVQVVAHGYYEVLE